MLQELPIFRSAKFDPTEQYRYWLGRRWQRTLPQLTIIMLNPSQADATVDDPTIRRCINLAHGWQFGAIIVVNLFAYRTAHPRELQQVTDPIGDGNNAALQKAASEGDKILLAWGNWGHLHGRDQAVLHRLSRFRDKFCCLERNRTGQPRHPLYIQREARLQPWTWSHCSQP